MKNFDVFQKKTDKNLTTVKKRSIFVIETNSNKPNFCLMDYSKMQMTLQKLSEEAEIKRVPNLLNHSNVMDAWNLAVSFNRHQNDELRDGFPDTEIYRAYMYDERLGYSHWITFRAKHNFSRKEYFIIVFFIQNYCATHDQIKRALKIWRNFDKNQKKFA